MSEHETPRPGDFQPADKQQSDVDGRKVLEAILVDDRPRRARRRPPAAGGRVGGARLCVRAEGAAGVEVRCVGRPGVASGDVHRCAWVAVVTLRRGAVPDRVQSVP